MTRQRLPARFEMLKMFVISNSNDLVDMLLLPPLISSVPTTSCQHLVKRNRICSLTLFCSQENVHPATAAGSEERHGAVPGVDVKGTKIDQISLCVEMCCVDNWTGGNHSTVDASC